MLYGILPTEYFVVVGFNSRKKQLVNCKGKPTAIIHPFSAYVEPAGGICFA